MVPALLLPFIEIGKFGNVRVTYLYSPVGGLLDSRVSLLALVVGFCAIVAPLGLQAAILAAHYGGGPLERRWRLRGLLREFDFWSIPEVYVLAVLVSLFKLGSLVEVEVSSGFWCYAVSAFVTLLAYRLWQQGPEAEASDGAARGDSAEGSRRSALAWSIGAAVMLVPANVLPVMESKVVGEPALESTILSGVARLLASGLWPLAAIVFIASVLVPALKLAGIGWLLYRTREGPSPSPRRDSRVYDWISVIGRWSMLDVFLVGFLVSAVQFGELAKVKPRWGIVAFAAAVIFTLFASRRFEPGQLWKNDPRTDGKPPRTR